MALVYKAEKRSSKQYSELSCTEAIQTIMINKQWLECRSI